MPACNLFINHTVNMANAMKISVAVMDLGDSLAIPQTPCPLVHPLPRLVPKPTRSPARTSHAVDCSIRMMGVNPANLAMIGARISPARKLIRQLRSPFDDRKRPPTMLLTPMIRP